MNKRQVPKGLRWFYFVLGIGTMVSAGIYLKGYIAGGTMLGEGLRSLMFCLLGTYFTLMYGENKRTPEDSVR